MQMHRSKRRCHYEGKEELFMKILLAHSERDLLNSYGKLLTMDGHEIVSAFDGAQVASHLEEQTFDLLLLEDRLPRLTRSPLLPLARSRNLPVIVLLDGRITVRHLLRQDLPEAYLALPFLPADLNDMMKLVMDLRQSEETLACGDTVLQISEFRFRASEKRVTAPEIQLLQRLEAGEKTEGRRNRTLILALNEKWAGMSSGTRIAYEQGKGYRLVIKDD